LDNTQDENKYDPNRDNRMPVIDRASVERAIKTSPSNTRRILKEIDLLSPIENRGDIPYLGDRRINYEFEGVDFLTPDHHK
jgi:hypothetical protein